MILDTVDDEQPTKEQLEDQAAAWRLIATRLATSRTKFKNGFCYHLNLGTWLTEGITWSLLAQMADRVSEHMNLLESTGAAHIDHCIIAYYDVPGRRPARILAALILAEECDEEAAAATSVIP